VVLDAAALGECLKSAFPSEVKSMKYHILCNIQESLQPQRLVRSAYLLFQAAFFTGNFVFFGIISLQFLKMRGFLDWMKDSQIGAGLVVIIVPTRSVNTVLERKSPWTVASFFPPLLSVQ
jgi:hypothetical protein